MAADPAAQPDEKNSLQAMQDRLTKHETETRGMQGTLAEIAKNTKATADTTKQQQDSSHNQMANFSPQIKMLLQQFNKFSHPLHYVKDGLNKAAGGDVSMADDKVVQAINEKLAEAVISYLLVPTPSPSTNPEATVTKRKEDEPLAASLNVANASPLADSQGQADDQAGVDAKAEHKATPSVSDIASSSEPDYHIRHQLS